MSWNKIKLQIAIQTAQFLLCMLHFKWDISHTYIKVQATLFSLFLLDYIHPLSSWGWSTILFVPDPLPASTIQTHKGETLTRRTRRKTAHIRVWLKPSKHSLLARSFFVIQIFATDERHMEKDILYFLQHVLFVFLWTFLRLMEPS